MAQRLRRTSTPIRLLLAVVVLSLGARLAWLEQPCRSPCRTAADHVLVFDESYYVNAARVIAGLAPPAGQHYARAPLGTDPNAEHPQLAKLVIAGSIELLGDGPLAWRLGSIIAGTLALVAMFALVRAAGGGEWVALGAAALMSADNLLLVHGRIATLDIYVLAAMLWGVVLYLRGRPVAAGMLVGIGACFKLVAPYAVAVLALYEALLLVSSTPTGLRGSWRAALARVGGCVAAAAAVGFGLLALMDRIAPPYGASAGKLVGGGPLGHLGHMLSYASQQTSPHGPTGIASYPWSWLIDLKPIVYLNVDPSRPARGLSGIHPAVHFLGLVSPPILLLALPGLVWTVWRLRVDRVAALAVGWFLGTFIPFGLLTLLWARTSYLYYMVIVMPGLYVAAACMVAALARRHRRLAALWGVTVLAAAVVLYPFTPLP
jgi:4-amino-4-deoxy-L-arabinose transferase-like glycosyltransferase